MRAIHKNSIPIPAILLNADTQAALQTLINTEKKAREKAVKS